MRARVEYWNSFPDGRSVGPFARSFVFKLQSLALKNWEDVVFSDWDYDVPATVMHRSISVDKSDSTQVNQNVIIVDHRRPTNLRLESLGRKQR